MRLLLDEMWPASIAEQLRRRGYDVDAVVARPDLRRMSDAELMQVAMQEGRVIVTENIDDFRVIARGWGRRGQQHAGLIYTSPQRFNRGHTRIVGRMVKALSALLEADISLQNVEHWLKDADQTN